MSEYQNYWLEMDHALQDIAKGRDNSESEEKRFISKYIKALDGKSVNPKVVQDRLDDGRSVRVYLWMNTSLGNIGLVTGKDIEPTLHYLVSESENYDDEKPDLIVPQNRKEDLVSISIPLDFPNRTNGKKSPKKKTKKRRTLKRNTSSDFKIDPNKVYSYQIAYNWQEGAWKEYHEGKATIFDIVKKIVRDGFHEKVDTDWSLVVKIKLEPFDTTPTLWLVHSDLEDYYALKLDSTHVEVLRISGNLIESAIQKEKAKASPSPDQKLDPNTKYPFEVFTQDKGKQGWDSWFIGEGTPFEMVKDIVKSLPAPPFGDQSFTIWIVFQEPYHDFPNMRLYYSVINDKYVLQDELGKVYLEISENLISSVNKNEADKESQSPSPDQKLDPNKEYAFQIYVLNTDDAMKEKEKGLPYYGSYLGGNTLKPKEMVEYIVNYVTNVYPLSDKQYVKVHIELVDGGDYYPYIFSIAPYQVDIYNPETDYVIYSTSVNLQTKESEVKDTISEPKSDEEKFKDALLTFYANAPLVPNLKTEIAHQIIDSAPKLMTNSGSVSLVWLDILKNVRGMEFQYQYEGNNFINVEFTPNDTYEESVDLLLVDSQSGNKSNFTFYNDEEQEQDWYRKFQKRVQLFYDLKVPKKSQSTSTPTQTEENLTFDQILSGLTFSHNEIDSLIQLCIAISDIVTAIESDSSYIQTLLVNEGTLTSGAILRFQKYLDKFIKPMGYQVQDGKFEYDVGKNALFVLYLSQTKDSDNKEKYIDFAVLVNDVAIWKPTLLDADDELDDSNKVKLYIEGGFNNPNFTEEVLNKITSYIKEVDSATQSDEEKFNIALNNFYNMKGDFKDVKPFVPPILDQSDWVFIIGTQTLSYTLFYDELKEVIKDYLSNSDLEFNENYKSVYKGKNFAQVRFELTFENSLLDDDRKAIKLEILFYDFDDYFIGSYSDITTVTPDSVYVPDYYDDIRENLLMESANWLIDELDAIKEPEVKDTTSDEMLELYTDLVDKEEFNETLREVWKGNTQIEELKPYLPSFLGSNDWHNDGNVFSLIVFDDDFYHLLKDFLKKDISFNEDIIWELAGKTLSYMDISLIFSGYDIDKEYLNVSIYVGFQAIDGSDIILSNSLETGFFNPMHGASVIDYYSVIVKNLIEPAQDLVLDKILNPQAPPSEKTIEKAKTFDQVFKEQYESNLKLTTKSREELKDTFPLFSSDLASFKMINVIFNGDMYVFNLTFQGIQAEFVIYIELSKLVDYPKVLIFEATSKGSYDDEDELDADVITEKILAFILDSGKGGWINLVLEEELSHILLLIQKEVFIEYYDFDPKAQGEKSQEEVSSTEAKLPLTNFNEVMNKVFYKYDALAYNNLKETIKKLAPKTLSVPNEQFMLYMVQFDDNPFGEGVQFIYVNKEYQVAIVIKQIGIPFSVYLTDLPSNYTQQMIFKIEPYGDKSKKKMNWVKGMEFILKASLLQMKVVSYTELEQKKNTTDFFTYGDVSGIELDKLYRIYDSLFELTEEALQKIQETKDILDSLVEVTNEQGVGVVKNPYLMSLKMSDRQPPPPSPLKNAYFGSNAYDNGTDEEMNLNNLFGSDLNQTSCPSFSEGTHTKYSSINPYNQQCFVIKNLAGTQGQAGIETLCAMLYRAMGIFVPDLRFTGGYLISPLVPERFNTNFSPFNFKELAITPKHRQKLVDLYIVSVWLANWDVTGMNNDNMLYSPSTKQFACIDVGGSLMLKANGKYKENWEGDKIWEMDKAEDIWKIVDVMQQELDDFLKPTYFAGKYFKQMKDMFPNLLPQMCLDTCKRILMLFYKDYNLVRKTLEWGDLPPAKLMTYKPFKNVKSKEEMQDLLEVFLFVRAAAMYLIFEEK